MANSFRTPALALLFSETSVSDKIQLFRVGSFQHPEYGRFDITPQMLAEIKKNFDANVRGIDLAVDYRHNNQDIAAGWLKDLELADNGNALYGKVEWTPAGKKVTSDKEYRYISPEFTFNYSDNETGKTFGPTLLGAALTNRPVIKKMDPVQLSEIKYADGEQEKLHQEQKARSEKYGIEVTSDSNLTPSSGGSSNEADYADPVNFKYPLQDKAQIANARVRFKQFANDTYKEPKSKNVVHERIVRAELAAGIEPSFDPKDALDSALPSDIKNKLQKGAKKMADNAQPGGDLSSLSPEQLVKMVQELQSKLADMEKQHQSMMAEKKMSEKKIAFAKLLSEGKACAAQEEAYLKDDMVKFIELAQPLKLSEEGTSTIRKETDASTAEEEIMNLAEEKVKNKKSKDIGSAISLVLAEKPELRKKYESSFKGE